MNHLDERLITTLFHKYQDGLLASLYLLTYQANTLSPEEWVESFIKKITPLADHPDILKVHKDDKSNEYKVDSPAIKSFLHFIHYRPLKLPKKFIFIFDAQDLSVIVSNKLLKVFEELGSEYCLFLLAPHDSSILPTVASRAVKLKITSLEGKQTSPTFGLNIQNPQDLIQQLKAAKEASAHEEKAFIESKISEHLTTVASRAPNDSFQSLSDLLDALSAYEKSSAFNNSKVSRLSVFFP
ncbi:MAG: hypothetical protein KBD76_03250 [Bacteriovorax sp.]|nr:hypothetical protein [Bacteriovorax sp.]